MPVYEYVCNCCSTRFEVRRGFNDESQIFCHLCGGRARRLFSPVPIIFKGPGFYITDSRAESSKKLTGRKNSSEPANCSESGEIEYESKQGVAA